ncbi:hypothetical protein Tco_0440043 [Tanacetum coccineum]
MSLGDSGSLDLPDTATINPALEATSLPKFDMHLYRSSLTETNVKWLTKCYGILADLHPRVPTEGIPYGSCTSCMMFSPLCSPISASEVGESSFLFFPLKGSAHISQLVPLGVQCSIYFEISSKNCKPCLKDAPTSLKKEKDKFFLVNRRATPIAMSWRHRDSSVSDPIPQPDEYNASDVVKLREVAIPLRKPPPSILYIACLSNVWKHAGRAFSIKDSNGEVITMAEFLRLPDFHGCKVSAGELLSPGSARVTHLTTPAEWVKDIPPKTRDMMVAELPCRKVSDDKERKKRKAEEKVAIHVQAKKVVKEKYSREGVCKKRRVHVVNHVQPTSEYVSSPTPLNHAEHLTTITGEAHVTPPTSVGRMGVLRDQTDEPVTPPVVNVGEFPTGGMQSPYNPYNMPSKQPLACSVSQKQPKVKCYQFGLSYCYV